MRHFTFKELTKSSTAAKLGIDNMPKDINIIDNLDNLIETVLEPLRLAMNFPVIISSGYRCEELNKAVGGVKNSRHRLGKAVDIRCSKARNKLIYDWLLAHKSSLPIKELIWENGGQWVHVAM